MPKILIDVRRRLKNTTANVKTSRMRIPSLNEFTRFISYKM